MSFIQQENRRNVALKAPVCILQLFLSSFAMPGVVVQGHVSVTVAEELASKFQGSPNKHVKLCIFKFVIIQPQVSN